MDTANRKKLTILSIEDSPIIQKMYEFEFAPLVKEFLFAEEATTALKIICERKNDIDLILMDIDLKQPSMNGLSLALYLKGKGIQLPIPIVVISSLSVPRKTQEKYASAIDDFYVKPLTAPQARHLVKRYSALRSKKTGLK